MLEVQSKQTECLERIIRQQEQTCMSLTLPTPIVTPFDGDPIKYHSFIKSFESLVESRTSSEVLRLQYLVQFTEGDVQKLVSSCLDMSPEICYRQARQLLKTTYGQSYTIASAHIDKITKGPAIRSEDSKSLHKLSIDVCSCMNVLENNNYANKMENPDSLRLLVGRLPYELRRKWRNIADRITEVENRDICLRDVVIFIEKEARVANHPVFGDISGSHHSTSKPANNLASVRSRASSYATDVKDTGMAENMTINNKLDKTRISYDQRKCVMCSEAHNIVDCKQFQANCVAERSNFAFKHGLCYNCLIPYHMARDCRKPPLCKHCNKKHSSLLHDQRDTTLKSETMSNTTPIEKIPHMNNAYISNHDTTQNKELCMDSSVGLPIIPVKAKAKDSDVMTITYAFLDPGSNGTFCSDDLKDSLHLQGKDVSYSLTTLHEENVTTDSKLVSLQVYDMDENMCIDLPCVFSRPALTVSRKDIPQQEDVDRWPHLDGIKVPHINADVGLLIGNDYVKALEPSEIRASQNDGPYAVRTALGWAINGPLGRYTSGNITSNFIKADMQLNEQFKEYCNREFTDSILNTNKLMSQDDIRAIQMMDNSIQFKDGHYELGLPFRHDLPMPNNRSMAEHRLQLLKRKLTSDQELYIKYDTFMTNLITKGYAERVPESDINRMDGRVWYLPHHSVTHTKKPDKARIVFDASAKYRGVSLNDTLLQGPDLTNSIIGVLIRFRQERIALASDIEAMFHQVHVPINQRDMLRFLWYSSGLETKPIEHRMTVHLFGATSSPSCCNYALKKTADDHLGDYNAKTLTTVHNNFYVDDCLKSLSSENDAVQLVHELSNLLHERGFHLTKWLSNSEEVMATISPDERASTVKDLDFSSIVIERALGIQWELSSDTFKFNVVIKEKPFTRRGILSVMSSIYDPLGFLAPVILPVKKMLQEFCRLKLSWDDPIPEIYARTWHRWLDDLSTLTEFSVPRCFKPAITNSTTRYELHHFADASQDGYGVVTYLRVITLGIPVHCSFIMGKSRVAPLKQISIPRMELSAGTLAVRQDKLVKQELDIIISKTQYWTDSTAVLKFIKNTDKRFHTFVANRISMIRDGSNTNDWYYIDTKQNPADDASRGLKAHQMVEGSRWCVGPSFLWCHESDWPVQPDTLGNIPDDHTEVKVVRSCLATNVTSSENDIMNELISRFSSWYKLKRIFAWILRYRLKLLTAARARMAGSHSTHDIHDIAVPPITLSELERAEHYILQHVQLCYACDKSSIRKLDPFMMDGLLRVGGRLSHSSLEINASHQIILPKDHIISKMIIDYYHHLSGHSGREYVLSLIRTKYWITRGNAAVRSVLSKCFDCKRKHGYVEHQKMANLPQDRFTTDKPPFTSTGIDFFGPYVVKRGRTSVKRYGLIFTCMTTRAVHIEVTHGLDTDSFLQAMSRFIARRGRPELIRSDNGGSFIRGEKEIKQGIASWNQDKIHNHLLQNDIQWIFNPPLGSHHGGVWERAIRSARRILNSLLQGQVIDDQCLVTLMAEVESIMNGRPITKVSNDYTDVEALTPNHLLLFRSTSLPLGTFSKEDMYYHRRWKQIQYMSELFWKRWIREYLPLLQQRQKWTSTMNNLKIGNIVLLVDNTVSRNCWPLGRVVEVFPGHDGLVRKVRVRTKSTELNRPITKLILLDNVYDIESN